MAFAALLGPVRAFAVAQDSNYSFGGGSFGDWALDSDSGAPMYSHHGVQLEAASIVPRSGTSLSSINDLVKLPNEQWFQVANERLVLVAN